ncbi:MAG: hypothetical protein GX275_03990 [Clostridiales bacterium]|nr:hypothetical protein [Clostridiales bacterium]
MHQKINKLQLRVIRLDLIVGFLISLISSVVLSLEISIVYYFGVIIALMNFLIHYYTTIKWLGNNLLLLSITSLLRVLIIALLVIPIRNNMSLVLAYVFAIIFHQVIVIYSTSRQKGSV